MLFMVQWKVKGFFRENVCSKKYQFDKNQEFLNIRYQVYINLNVKVNGYLLKHYTNSTIY